MGNCAKGQNKHTKTTKYKLLSEPHKIYILIIGSTKLIPCHQYYFISLTQLSDNLEQTSKSGNIIVEHRRWLLLIPPLSNPN